MNPARVRDDYRQGVGIVLLNSHGKVLICRRIDIEGGAWQMPQGGCERGENPRTCAFRELKEEIGTYSAVVLAESKDFHQYNLPEALRAHAWGGRYRGQRLKWFAMRFTGKDDDINVDGHNAEFDGWLWVPHEHVADLVVAFKQPMYQAVLTEFHEVLTATRPVR
jgi:putative (di)nucleoside polyphosphate hydrolase